MSLSVRQISITPTITAGAYTANDCIGGLLKFKGSDQLKSGYVHALTVFDDASQEAALDLAIFKSKPSASTFTDDAAAGLAAADADKLIGVINLATTDWVSYSGGSIAHVGVKSIPFSLDNGSELYCALTTPSTPTYAATDDLVITLGMFNDE